MTISAYFKKQKGIAMYKDELFDFEVLTYTDVCVQLRAMLSEMEDRMLNNSTIPFDSYREGLRLSALKTAFDYYRYKMLESIEKSKEEDDGDV